MRMRIVKGVIPFAVIFAVVTAVTAVLLHFKLAGLGPHHPIFFYLLPIALVAIRFGSLPATLFAGAATLCGAFFLYDPIYSFQVANPRELGDLVCFAVLALMAVKCTFELLRPVAKIPAVTPRYGRPQRAQAQSLQIESTAL
jgi:K+-sensing histidine kinase KdpD